MTYEIAEIFDSVQGEGVYSGTPMTFIRFVGCTVGKGICHACDTEFDKKLTWHGGGTYTVEQLLERVNKSRHVCFTGGEPLAQDLRPLLVAFQGKSIHIETSGTIDFTWMKRYQLSNYIREFEVGERTERAWIWIACSPKPGFIHQQLGHANELKVIVPGLGPGPGWPGLELALEFSETIPVYLQPRNERDRVRRENLELCMDLVLRNPSLRLSPQLHKFLAVR